jgi:FAD/FMN-containing dehydrogenase
VPRGWFLPVTPGTKYITLGGAIANDVHGKNHHRRGTFGCHVRRFRLLRSDTGRMICSADENSDLFSATIGGLGLTGIIEWAEIQLAPIRSSQINGITQRFGDLDEFFALSEDLDEQHEFCVAWIDCQARGKNAGRGVCMAGDFASEGPLVVEGKRKFTVPLVPPISLVNSLSLKAFNALYWHKASASRRRATIGYDPFFYPLDAILKWNRIYGPRGFQQYQALIPQAQDRTGIGALLNAIAESGTGSFLAVLKRCGNVKSPGLLSFPQPGTTLALDFPQNERLAATLFPRLDAIVREAGGRLYPAKDAHWSGEDFRHGYPAWRQLESVRDPALISRFWKRVTP